MPSSLPSPTPSNDANPKENRSVDLLESRLRKKIYQKWTSLTDAFRGIDASNTGVISKEDFRTTLGRLNLLEGLGEQDLENLVRRFDKNGNGVVSYQVLGW